MRRAWSVVALASAPAAALFGCANLWGFAPLIEGADGGPDARVEASSDGLAHGEDVADAVCSLRGRETDCGACISSCGPLLAACCGDETCATTLLPPAGACAGGNAAACALVAAEVVAENAAVAGLAGCVAMNCLTLDCPTKSPTSRTNCFLPSAIGSRTCSCTLSPQTSNDLVCSSEAFPGTVCCAHDGWPDASPLECDCKVLSCQPSTCGGGESCACSLGLSAAGTSSCSGAICCRDHDTCSCGTDPCVAGQTQVKKCTLSAIDCPQNFFEVPSCSIHVDP